MGIDQLILLREKHQQLESAWYRQILTIAAGGFALLVGLGPTVSPGPGRYFLAGTWLFLWIGILSGSAAIYQEASLAINKADKYQAQLMRNIEAGIPAITEYDSAEPGRIFVWSRKVMVFSLLLAVVCLVSYSILRTLW